MAALWCRSFSAKLSAKPRASATCSGGKLRPGIGTLICFLAACGASEVNASSASGSAAMARAVPPSTALNSSMGERSVMLSFSRNDEMGHHATSPPNLPGDRKIDVKGRPVTVRVQQLGGGIIQIYKMKY